MTRLPAQAGDTGMTTPRGRGRPGHDADSVVAVATRVFTERGFDGTSMDDLAGVLGISKSSIYHHVSGKTELLERALDRALAALEAALGEVEASDAPPAALLEQGVQGAVATLIRELPSVTLLLRVRGNSEVERAALTRRRALDARFAALVARAAETGQVRSDLDPAIVSRLVFGAVNSLVEWYRPHDGPGVIHPEAMAATVADTLCAIVFDGLRSEGNERAWSARFCG